jgi:threonyl-tRNA synthetase
MKARNMDYEVDEGGGVFYAPKIDIKLFDAIGREWQGPTIQVDLNLPKRFDVTYIGEDGNRHQAVMVHRAVLGSMERFCGGLIEHYAGRFPVWLAPMQVSVLPISDRHQQKAKELSEELKKHDIRVHLDDRPETIQYKIRDAQMEQVPYMLVIGDKEMENNVVAVRHRQGGQVGTMKFEEFLEKIKSEIEKREA